MLPLLNRLWRSPLGPPSSPGQCRCVSGHTRPAYLLRLLCPWVMRGDYPLGALGAAGCVAWVLRSPLGPWYAPTGSEDRGGSVHSALASELDGHEAYYRPLQPLRAASSTAHQGGVTGTGWGYTSAAPHPSPRAPRRRRRDCHRQLAGYMSECFLYSIGSGARR